MERFINKFATGTMKKNNEEEDDYDYGSSDDSANGISNLYYQGL